MSEQPHPVLFGRPNTVPPNWESKGTLALLFHVLNWSCLRYESVHVQHVTFSLAARGGSSCDAHTYA